MSAPHSHDQSVLTRRRLGVLATAALAAGVAGFAPPAEAAGKYDLGTATLHKGSRGTHVKALQKALNDKISAGLKVDGVFGTGTERALKSYQKKKHLSVDGRCGPATRKALNTTSSTPPPKGGKYDLGTTTLHKGSRGTHVKALQKALNDKIKAGLKVDGVFGTGTERALKSYQKKKHLSVDGRCGPATRKALNGGGGTPSGWLLPVHGAYRVSSEFNPKRRNPVTHKITPHVGIDLAVASGRRIYAVKAGKVTHAGHDPFDHGKRGNQVTIDHGNGYTTMYEHLSHWDVKVGQKVKADQKIANSGNTGRSTGPHLHFGVLHKGEFINPRKILNF